MAGLVVLVKVTVKAPHNLELEEPLTLSNQMLAEEEAGTSTEVLISG